MLKITVNETEYRKEYKLSCEHMKLNNLVTVDRQPSNFEKFKYWFEQQRFYLTDTQFLFCQSHWLQMVIDEFEKKDELGF